MMTVGLYFVATWAMAWIAFYLTGESAFVTRTLPALLTTAFFVWFTALRSRLFRQSTGERWLLGAISGAMSAGIIASIWRW